MCTMKLLLYVCTVVCAMLVETAQARRVLRAYRIRECPDNPADAAVALNFTLTQNNAVGSYISGYIQVNRDLPSVQLKLVLTRCQIQEAPDTCESFNLNPSNTCMLFSMDNTAWTPIFKKCVPQFKCPLKKGIYALENGYIDMDSLQIVPVDSYYNTVSYRVFEKKRMVASLCTEFRILNIE